MTCINNFRLKLDVVGNNIPISAKQCSLGGQFTKNNAEG